MSSTKVGIGIVALLCLIVIGYFASQEAGTREPRVDESDSEPPVAAGLSSDGAPNRSRETSLAADNRTDAESAAALIDRLKSHYNTNDTAPGARSAATTDDSTENPDRTTANTDNTTTETGDNPVAANGATDDAVESAAADSVDASPGTSADTTDDQPGPDAGRQRVAQADDAASSLLDRMRRHREAADGNAADNGDDERADNGSTVAETDEEDTPSAGAGDATAEGETATRRDRRVPSTYTIAEDDTFSSIAQRYYGQARYWWAIEDANPQADPKRLAVGQTIKLPPYDQIVKPSQSRTSTTFPDPPSGPGKVHIVGEDDSLWNIAMLHYGSGYRWNLIYEKNRSVIGENPNVLPQGMKLRIPPAPTDDDN